MNQKVSPCYYRRPTVTHKYQSKLTPIAVLHAEELAEADFLYVFRISFPALYTGYMIIYRIYDNGKLTIDCMDE